MMNLKYLTALASIAALFAVTMPSDASARDGYRDGRGGHHYKGGGRHDYGNRGYRSRNYGNRNYSYRGTRHQNYNRGYGRNYNKGYRHGYKNNKRAYKRGYRHGYRHDYRPYKRGYRHGYRHHYRPYGHSYWRGGYRPYRHGYRRGYRHGYRHYGYHNNGYWVPFAILGTAALAYTIAESNDNERVYYDNSRPAPQASNRPCHVVHKIESAEGYQVKMGATMCYDANGSAYIVSGSEHVVEQLP